MFPFINLHCLLVPFYVFDALEYRLFQHVLRVSLSCTFVKAYFIQMMLSAGSCDFASTQKNLQCTTL